MSLLKPFLMFYVPFLVLYFFTKRYRRSLLLPPGPKGLPIVGNMFQLQATIGERPWITFNNWAQIYGDIFTFDVLGARTVILNSYKDIVNLLDHKSYNYSDRTYQPMLHELTRWGWLLPFMPYSDSWRQHRRIFTQSFRPQAMPEYFNILREKTAILMQKLKASPKDFIDHVRAGPGETILEIVYGYRTKELIDPYIKLVDDAMAGLNATGVQGTYLVDFFPFLKHVPAWFPGAGFRIDAEKWAKLTDQLKDQPWALVTSRIKSGEGISCFCTQNLEKYNVTPNAEGKVTVIEEALKNVAAAAYLGGAETTVSAILSFILGMVLNPQAQARAQAELDEVTGSARLPDFGDCKELPYIGAILSETLRWNPVAPMAIPHRSLQDDTHEGYLIPGGSTIIPNVWAVFHDESLYGPDTMSFNPDRFMKQGGKGLPPDPEMIAFGFGRRICPGRYFAINSVWLTMTYLLANFTIVKELDKDGKEITPTVEYTRGITSHPRPFSCRFIPRSSAPAFNQ